MLYLIIYYYKCKLYFIFNIKTEIFFKNNINLQICKINDKTAGS